MIQVDVVLAIAIILSVCLAVVFVLWIFYNLRRGKETPPAGSVGQAQQCPYCTHVFVSCTQGDLLMCPRCKSYIGDAPIRK